MNRGSAAQDHGSGSARQRIRIGVSSCLLGNEVRYDGGHKRDAFLTEVLAPFVEWVPVCPEVEAGMGTPREAVRLVRRDEELRMVGVRTDRDHTATMRRWVRGRVKELARMDLRGYVLKKGSPSCGMERVPIYRSSGPPERNGRGLFAAELMRRLPGLPVEEEGRLNDPHLRDNFVERVFAYDRLRSLFAGRWTRGDVVAFHAAHKYQLLAHSPQAYRELGRLVASVKSLRRAEFRARYETAFMEALARPATSRRHVNVLHHMLGHLRKHLGAAARADVLAAIEDYGSGLLPLVVPVGLLRHYVVVHDVGYLRDQSYLRPHPKELMLRNRV